MTRAEIKSEVFRRLQESSSAPVYWTEDDVETAIDEGYAEISDATEWYERYITVDLLNERPWYDARTVIGDSCLAVGPVFNEQTNRWLTSNAITDLDKGDRRWERVTGEPQRILRRGLWWFGYWPRVTADSGTVKQYFTGLPDAMDEELDEPGFPEPYHYGLVEYALYDLWAQDAESQKALQAWQAYIGYETGLLAFVDDRIQVPMWRGAQG
jgi:hypothetical protein